MSKLKQALSEIEELKQDLAEREAMIKRFGEFRQWLFNRVNEIASAKVREIRLDLDFDALLKEYENEPEKKDEN